MISMTALETVPFNSLTGIVLVEQARGGHLDEVALWCIGSGVVGGGGGEVTRGGRSVSYCGRVRPSGIHSFRHTWRLFLRSVARPIQSYPFNSSAPAQPSTISFLFASTAEKKREKKTLLATK